MNSRRQKSPLVAGGLGVLVLILVLVLVLVSWWIWGQGGSPTEAVTAAPGSARGSLLAQQEPEKRHAEVVAPSTPTPSAEPPTPVIDEIEVEKPEVCVGEENLVTVTAHSPDGDDSQLHYFVGGSEGRQAPVRVFAPEVPADAWPTISVFGRANVVTRVPVPAFKVKDCKPPRVAVIVARLMPNAPDEYEFSARVIEGAAADASTPFHPVKWAWSFGDGKTDASSTARIVHSYREREQQSLFSTMLVSLEVFGDDGQSVKARLPLQLLNTAFENLQRLGLVTLTAQPTPRFPEVSDDGKVKQVFTLWHNYKSPVTIERVSAVSHLFLDGNNPAAQSSVDVGGSLGLKTIPVGKDVKVNVEVDFSKKQGVAFITYELAGRTTDGLPVQGSFSVMLPPPRPTASNSTKVTDQQLVEKILLARRLLGKEFVTEEDLLTLEREGRFASEGNRQ